MPKITSLEDLNRLQIELTMQRDEATRSGATLVKVGTGSCGIAAGALEVLKALEQEIQAHEMGNVLISQTGCIGRCSDEPIVEVTIGKKPAVAYGGVNPEKVKRIVQEHLRGGKPIEELKIDITPFPTM